MAMNLANADGDEDQMNSTINTTPLVDVMLVLLIIFLITIPVVTQSVQLELPKELAKLHINQTLSAAQKLSESSVVSIGEEMRRIYELARSQADGLKKVAAQFSEQGDAQAHANIATTIEQLSSQMRAFGQEILERTQRQARDIEQARVWTNNIVKLGQAIAAIASNARILTFNARLESARIGEAGRGFAVIAGSIQELATQVRQTNQSVAELAENLAAALPRLGVDAAETSKSARESVGQLEQQLIDVQARLAGVRNDSWEALSDSSSMAQELQTKANTVIHHLQFQDRTSQMLAEAVQQATAVIAVAGLQERQYDDQVIGQVGVLGRQLGTEVEVKAPGSIEMF
jgi:biopolymer transport protein ExbD